MAVDTTRTDPYRNFRFRVEIDGIDHGGFREVTVPVEVGHLPPGLATSSQVDVWVTPEAGGDQPAPAGEPTTTRDLELRGAQLVLQGVTVLDVRADGGAFSGTTSIPVVLQVRPADVAGLISAMSLGRIDLVRVPRAVEGSGRIDASGGSG